MTRMLKERKSCKRRKGRDLLKSLCIKHTKPDKVTLTTKEKYCLNEKSFVQVLWKYVDKTVRLHQGLL